jgi:uncharacterized protein YjbI with pentapeptide repeats
MVRKVFKSMLRRSLDKVKELESIGNKIIAKSIASRSRLVLVLLVIFAIFWYFQQRNIDYLDGKIKGYEARVDRVTDVDKRITLQKDIVVLEKDKATLQNGVYTTLVQALGGLILSVTAWVGYQNFRVGEKNLRATEDKQVTERFSKSIEHLGNDQIDIRLGGIYALEQIAIDSPKYHWTIVEILSAFIREKCSINPQTSPDSNPEEATSEIDRKIGIDIQAALTVLGRRKAAQDPATKNIDLRNVNLYGAEIPESNLSEANLNGADLSEANLSGANLNGANLIEANLIEANLNGADLSEANLSGANLIGANLNGAYLIRADLIRADLIGADLSRADLIGANLSGANLSGANLSRADLIGANLSGANLIRADLSGADLIRADLSGADLNGADLIEANLNGAYLIRADLIRANLSGADLSGAYLRETKLSLSVNLTQAQIDSAITDELTELPDGLRRSSNPESDG